MERMICQCCGEALHKRGDFYECRYCGAVYRDDQAERAAELLRGLLDDFKIEQLSNARRRLYEATHEKYPSSQAVTQAAGAVLSVSPDDFMARVYLHSHDSDPHELIALLSRGTVSEWEAKEAVAWLTRSLDMRALAAVKDFADRHLKGAEKTEALNRIEEEAFKLDSGVYDLSLRRDVFLCYSAEDMPRVIEVMEMLEENALSCFAAFRNLRHGKGAQENYRDAIFRAMGNCRVFVFLSSNSSRDPHRKGVAEELDHLVGDLKDKPRVEFLLEDYPERMPILAKRRMAEAFPHLEYCRDAEDLVVRVSGLLDAEENAERERARKIAEEASERAKKELQAEFEAREAARKEELEERLRLEKEKFEVERRRIEAQKGSSALPPGGGAMDAESMLAMMEKAEELKRKRAEEAEAEAVVDAIKAIGRVEFTPECRERIAAARTRYSGLTEGQRAHVHNADVLLAAEREYGEAEAKERAATAKRAIEAIGGVEYSPKCKSRIDEAQRLYDAIPENCKALVSNHDTLASARAEYKKLEAEAEERKRLKEEEVEAAKRTDAIFDMKILPDGNASVAKCRNEKITGADIPERYRGRAVTSIGVEAFRNCKSLKSIAIPESVTSIGEKAFDGCSSLTSITIPKSVTSIGSCAFLCCYRLAEVINLSSLDISKGSEEYGYVGCYALGVISSASESKLHVGQDGVVTYVDGPSVTLVGYFGGSRAVTIPEGVTSIGERAFNRCTSLISITISKSVTSIGEDAFFECSSLTSITIPEGVTSIGKGAFASCSSLKSIAIPESVTSMGAYAFSCCKSLKSIAIPKGVTSIGDSAFSFCTSLASITIPKGVTSIGECAFEGCKSLKSIAIPKGVTSIGEKAFYYCSSLTSITIPESVTSIGKAFYECPCDIHFAHKKPLFGYPKGFPVDCLKEIKGKVFWGGK